MDTNIRAFKGLNNVSNPLRLGLGWLAQADNIDVSETGAIVKRSGCSLAMAGNILSGFSTYDYNRMYLVDGGNLKTMTGPASSKTLKTGLSSAVMNWTEINDQVFYNNGVDRGIIFQDNTLKDWAWVQPGVVSLSAGTGNLDAGTYQVRCLFILPDGRKTGASDDGVAFTLTSGQSLVISNIPQTSGGRTEVYIAPANSTVYQLAATTTATAMVWNATPETLGMDLPIGLLDPLPVGADIILAWKSRIYASQFMPTENQTVIWYSQPLGFHLFDLSSDFFIVPGKVLMLAHHDDVVIVGTDQRIFAYDATGIKELASYGVVPGVNWDEDEGQTYFWTTRGLCQALPFKNLTESHVSVAPGVQAGGLIVRKGGRKRYLVALHQGGTAFNTYS